MNSALRHLLPFGLVRASQFASKLKRMGLPASQAWLLTLKPSSRLRIQELNLNLLPDGALSDIDCIVDLGANRGDWTAGILNFCTPKRIICVEPEPALAAGLHERFSGQDNISIKQTAIGAAPGIADFTLMKESVFNSFRRPTQSMASSYQDVGARKIIKVDVRTLDSIIPTDARIRLLKIDVQGFEREVLIGAAETLRRTDYVLLEVNFQTHYEGEAGFFELDTLMQQHGFFIGNYSQPKGGRRQALYADVLYLRKDC